MSIAQRLLLTLPFLGAAGGSIVIQHLINGTIPSWVQPLAVRWIKAEHDPKWVNTTLWSLFWICALTFLAGMGTILYLTALDLGKNFQDW
jgi:hypothetical protein